MSEDSDEQKSVSGSTKAEKEDARGAILSEAGSAVWIGPLGYRVIVSADHIILQELTA